MRIIVRVLMVTIIGLATFVFLPLGNAEQSSTSVDIFMLILVLMMQLQSHGYLRNHRPTL